VLNNLLGASNGKAWIISAIPDSNNQGSNTGIEKEILEKTYVDLEISAL
jgi:hypothetical protein